jgi:hypothetical protein
MRTGLVLAGSLLLFWLICGTAHADTIDHYIATDQVVNLTPTSYTEDWAFNGPTLFTAAVDFTESFGPPGTGPLFFFNGVNVAGDFPIGGFLSGLVHTLQDSGVGNPQDVPQGMEGIYQVAVTVNDPNIQGAQGWDFTSLGNVPINPEGGPPPTETSEPSSMLLMGTGLVGLGFMAKKRFLIF